MNRCVRARSGHQINDFNPASLPADCSGQPPFSPTTWTSTSRKVRRRCASVTWPFWTFTISATALFGGGAPPRPRLSLSRSLVGRPGARADQERGSGFSGASSSATRRKWSGPQPRKNFTFASAPANTSSSVFAELGHMRNGSFFADE